MSDSMSEKTSEMEDRLDDMLSRIAMETQEIKELEQQLTDGEETTDQSLSLSHTGALRLAEHKCPPVLLLQVRSWLTKLFRGIWRESSLDFRSI